MPSTPNSPTKKNERRIRVLTFNTWRMGSMLKDGMEKLCRHIKHIQPDIMCIQEVMKEEQFKDMLHKLGPDWDGVLPDDWSYIPSNAIICYRPNIRMLKQYKTELDAGQGPIVGVRLIAKHLNNLEFEVYGVHLDWRGYGPELLAFSDRSCGLYDVIKAESNPDDDPDNCRVGQIRRLLSQARVVECLGHADKRPVIIAGDFNCPSHLDWIHKNKKDHKNLEIEWPAPKLLTEAGLIDSYRKVHPCPVKTPGLTWSPVYKKHDKTGEPYPQDRIDFIFYKSARLEPIDSQVYQGHPNDRVVAIPDHDTNDWPSDHAAVYTDFRVLTDQEMPIQPVMRASYQGEQGMSGGRSSNYSPPPPRPSGGSASHYENRGSPSRMKRAREVVSARCTIL